MMYLKFLEWPLALALVIILPLAVVYLIMRGRRRRALRLGKLGTADMIARLAPQIATGSRWHVVRAVLYSALFGLAFAGPRWGISNNAVAQKGVDIVLALDASQSMLATDEQPTRLAAMKEAVYRLREISPSDRFALVVFAGRSYILSPMTTDDAALNLFLDNLDPTTVGQGGSSLSSAVRQATNLLVVGQSESGKAIVLMSDGEGFEDDREIVTEAKRAADLGIRVIAVGFGTTAGARIPIRENGAVTDKKDASGAVVITRYSPTMLQDAAKAGGGNFILPGDPDRARHIRAGLTGLRAGAGVAGRGSDLAPRFQWFLLPAILLLVLDTLRSAMRSRRRRVSVDATTSIAALLLLTTSCKRDSDRELYPLYDRGTALLKADSLVAAEPMLEKATAAKSSELRFRARFNLGYAQLVRGLRYSRAKNDSSEAMLDSTLAVYRLALVERPATLDAKWNYELALRAQKGGGGGGGGGGGASPEPQPSPNQSDAQMPVPKAVGGMGVDKAEKLLNAIADQEQDVQGRKQRKNVPQEPPRGKDW